MESKDKSMSGGTNIAVKGSAGPALHCEITLDTRKPRLKLKIKNKIVGYYDFDDLINNSLEDNVMNKKFLKLWKEKFSTSSEMLGDFISQMDAELK